MRGSLGGCTCNAPRAGRVHRQTLYTSDLISPGPRPSAIPSTVRRALLSHGCRPLPCGVNIHNGILFHPPACEPSKCPRHPSVHALNEDDDDDDDKTRINLIRALSVRHVPVTALNVLRLLAHNDSNGWILLLILIYRGGN